LLVCVCSLPCRQMHASLRELEDNLSQISASQAYANRGIYILCKVLGELLRGAGGRNASVVELESYIQQKPFDSDRVHIAVGISEVDLSAGLWVQYTW
jgi:hypothetical protein